MELIQAKRTLGQNFLVDKNIANKIVDCLDCKPGEFVMEIGPGTGALTGLLLEKGINLLAVEIDQRAIEVLLNTYPKSKYPNFSIQSGDIREHDLNIYAGLANGMLKVIGNIPYNLSSDIIFYLFQNSSIISKVILMLQKEVAERLIAKQKTKAYGILTIATSMLCKSKILFDVSPSCFIPKPSITSSIIEIEFLHDKERERVFSKVMALIRAAFNQRRKVLKNSLTSYIHSIVDAEIDYVVALAEEKGLLYFSKRAEELKPEDFIILYNFFCEIRLNEKREQ